jgi:hypothetical protein
MTVQHGAASRAPWVFASARLDQNIERVERFIAAHGDLGAKIWRFEWRNFKRVLRPTFQRRFMPVRMGDREFYRKLYCLDARDWDDYQLLIDADAAKRPPRKPDPEAQVKQEWLRHVLKPEQFYSVPHIKTEIGEDGAAVEVQETTYFQVLELQHGSSRAKTVSTMVENEQDAARQSSLAASVNYLEVWKTESPTHQTCYFDSDPVFINALDIAPWAALNRMITSWTPVPSEIPKCIGLKKGVTHSGFLPIDLMLDNVPIYCLLHRLKVLTWE